MKDFCSKEKSFICKGADILHNPDLGANQESEYYVGFHYDVYAEPPRSNPKGPLEITSTMGHLYFETINLKTGARKFYGKDPAIPKTPFAFAVTNGRDELKRNLNAQAYEEQTGKKISVSKYFPVAEKTFTSGISKIEAEMKSLSGQVYMGIGGSCINFTQFAYQAFELPGGFFTANYSRDEMKNIHRSAAEKYIGAVWPNKQTWQIIERGLGDTEESVARELKISPEMVTEADNGRIYGTSSDGKKSFLIRRDLGETERQAEVAKAAQVAIGRLSSLDLQLKGEKEFEPHEQFFASLVSTEYFDKLALLGVKGIESNAAFVTGRGELGVLHEHFFKTQYATVECSSERAIDQALARYKAILASTDAIARREAHNSKKNVEEVNNDTLRHEVAEYINTSDMEQEKSCDLSLVYNKLTGKNPSTLKSVNDLLSDLKPCVKVVMSEGLPALLAHTILKPAASAQAAAEPAKPQPQPRAQTTPQPAQAATEPMKPQPQALDNSKPLGTSVSSLSEAMASIKKMLDELEALKRKYPSSTSSKPAASAQAPAEPAKPQPQLQPINDPKLFTALGSLKEVLKHSFGVESAPLFVGSSKEAVAKALNIDKEDVAERYVASSAVAKGGKGLEPMSKVFGVYNNYKLSEHKGFLHTSEFAKPIRDAEFLNKFLNLPLTINAGRITVAPVEKAPHVPIFDYSAFSVLNPTKPAAKVDNSKLRVAVSEDIAKDHKENKSGLGDLWKNGVASYGHHHEVRMPPSILNGDGAKNVRPSHMVTGGWRPGAKELSTFNTDKHLRNAMEWSKQGSLHDRIDRMQQMKMAAAYDRCKLGSFDQLNIDPLVVDLSGKGLQLTHWKKNKVMFDIDGDGYLEETGWVGPEMGFLILGKKSKITSIQDLLSERWNGRQYKDGFEALLSVCPTGSTSRIIDSLHPLYKALYIWINKAQDGVFQESDLKSLSELGIKAVVLEKIDQVKEKLEGNKITARAKIVMHDGSERELVSVDFKANPAGHKYEQSLSGTFVTSHATTIKIIEDEKLKKVGTQAKGYQTKSFLPDPESTNKKFDAAKLGVDNIYATGSGNELVGSEGDNWLVGGAGGKNKYNGVTGDNTLVISGNDENADIRGGSGFNTALIIGNNRMYLDLEQTEVSVVVGSGMGDVLDARNTGHNVFMQAGAGGNLLIGGQAESVLSGGEDDDLLVGGTGGGIFRANGGNNIVVAQAGNCIMESGPGFNYLQGGTGRNVFQCNSKGYAICDGSKGQFNIMELRGSIYDYDFSFNSEDHVTIRDKRDIKGFSAVAINVHKFNFGDISNYSVDTLLPRKWMLPLDLSHNIITLQVSKLLEGEFPKSAKAQLCEIHEVVGAKVTDIRGNDIIDYNLKGLTKIQLRVDPKYKGPVYIKYTPAKASGEFATFSNKDGDKSSLSFSVLSFRGGTKYADEQYRKIIDSTKVEAEYQGTGLRVQVYEAEDIVHNQSVVATIAKVLPRANIFFDTTMLFNDPKGLSAANWSFSVHHYLSPIDGLSNNAIGCLNEENDTYSSLLKLITSNNGLPIVISAGNSREIGADTNYCLIKSHPMSIVVGGILQEGKLGLAQTTCKPFSNPGATILVSAPANLLPVTTAGLENDFGVRRVETSALAQGTSFSAPLVTGVIGMMKEANAALSLLDIKRILAYGATKVPGESEWHTNSATIWNGGGLHFSNDYGFGCVNAYNSVRLAESWVEYNTALQYGSASSSQGSFQSSALIITTGVELGEEIQMVSLVTSLTISDLMKFNLTFEIGGDKVKVLDPKVGAQVKPAPLQDLLLTLSTYAYMGVASAKGFKFVASTEDGHKTRIKGHEFKVYYIKKDHTTFIFTDEAKETYNAGHSVLRAYKPFNTLNLAAVTMEVQVNLSEHWLKLAGNIYKLEGNFQNVFAGDGAATLIGDENDNVLVAGRGTNYIDGVGGHNILCTARGLEPNFTTLVSGKGADMFVIRRSPGSKTIIKKFKVAKFDDSHTKTHEKLSDIINFVGWKELKSLGDLKVEGQANNLVIRLPDKQEVVVEGITGLAAHNVIFDDKFDFFSLFDNEHLPSNIAFFQAIYGVNQPIVQQTTSEVCQSLSDEEYLQNLDWVKYGVDAKPMITNFSSHVEAWLGNGLKSWQAKVDQKRAELTKGCERKIAIQKSILQSRFNEEQKKILDAKKLEFGKELFSSPGRIEREISKTQIEVTNPKLAERKNAEAKAQTDAALARVNKELADFRALMQTKLDNELDRVAKLCNNRKDKIMTEANTKIDSAYERAAEGISGNVLAAEFKAFEEAVLPTVDVELEAALAGMQV
jgi:Ca2+-binding RTX toxin-like protein